MDDDYNRPVSRDDLLFTVEMALRKAERFWPKKRRPGDHDRLRPVAYGIVEHMELWGLKCFRRPCSRDRRRGFIANPLVEAGSYRTGPAAFLAACGRQRFGAGIGDHVGGKGPDVIGDVDVFGEPADCTVCFRQRGSAFESKVLAERSVEQRAERCDDPDVLLQQERTVRAAAFDNAECIAAVFGGQRLIWRLRHA